MTQRMRHQVLRIGAIAKLGERLHGMQEVGGSIPPGSTNLRAQRCIFLLNRERRRLPDVARRAKTGDNRLMKYVYILESIASPGETYIGLTDDLRQRLAAHNAGQSKHTQKFKPWRLVTYIGFSEEQKAVDFERYLKSSSSRAFAKKRLR